MTANASGYRYREDTRGWGNNPRNVTQRDSLHLQLMRSFPAKAEPVAWDHVSNFVGRNVWGMFDGQRQLLHVNGLAPAGNEGERWYVMPCRTSKCLIMSVSKANLELFKPVAVKALVLVPEIKTRPVRRALTTPTVIYL